MTAYRIITVTYNNGNVEKKEFGPNQQEEFWTTNEKLIADQLFYKEIKDITSELEIR